MTAKNIVPLPQNRVGESDPYSIETASSLALPQITGLPVPSAHSADLSIQAAQLSTVKRFCTYARASEPTERTGSHTFQTQRNEIEERLIRDYGEHGFTLDYYHDDGVTGAAGYEKSYRSRRVRSGFTQMRDAIRNDEYTGFILLSINRMARNTLLTLELIEREVMPRRMDFISIMEPGDIYTPEGYMMISMLSSVYQYQRDEGAKRIKLATETTLKSGYIVGIPGYGWRRETREEVEKRTLGIQPQSCADQSQPLNAGAADATAPATVKPADGEKCTTDTPVLEAALEATPLETTAPDEAVASQSQTKPSIPGYGRVRARLISVEEEKQVVLKMKSLYISGAGYGKIAQQLNREGVTSPSGGQWNLKAIERILFDPLHVGFVKRKEEIYPGEHVDRRFYDPEEREFLLQLKAERSGRFKTNTAKTVTRYLLNGIALCDHCGRRLYISSPETRTPSLRCLNGMDYGQRTCPHLTVQVQPLENTVLSRIEELSRHPQLRELLYQSATEALHTEDELLLQKQETLANALRLSQDRINRLFDNWTSDPAHETQFRLQNNRLMTERAGLEAEAVEVHRQIENRQRREAKASAVRELILDFADLWNKRTCEERRAILDSLIEHLRIHRRGDVIVMKLKLYLLPESETEIIYPSRALKKKNSSKSGVESLGPRQLTFLYYWSKGKKYQEISELMGIAESTVRSYKTGIRRALGTWEMNEACGEAHTRITAMLPHLPLGQREKNELMGDSPLTRLQAEVWRFIRRGATSKETARALGITESAVHCRRKVIYQLLGAKSLYEAIQAAEKLGIAD